MKSTAIRSMAAGVALIFSLANTAGAAVMGRGYAASNGKGDVNFCVDTSQDAEGIMDILRNQGELSGGANPTEIEVKNGNAKVIFADAQPGEVQFALPDDVANHIGGSCLVGAATLGGVGGLLASKGAVYGAAGLALTGTGLGIAASKGAFDSEKPKTSKK